MNAPLMIVGALLIIVSGYALGSQITAALLNPTQIPFHAPIFILGGIAVNALGFLPFLKGFKEAIADIR